jgi:hypothetical protein
MAETTVGRDGRVAHALPLERLLEIVERDKPKGKRGER